MDMTAGRTARSTSIDLFASETLTTRNGRSLRESFEKLAKGSEGASPEKAGLTNQPYTSKYEGKLIWRDRKVHASHGKWRNSAYITLGLAAASFLILAYSGFISPSSVFSLVKPFSRPPACNPYAVSGTLHIDYSEPANNHWEPTDKTCPSPRYMRQLINGNYAGLDFMRDKTVLLYGDSIERDHVSLFCHILGREPEVVKGSHRYASAADSIVSPRVDDKRKKERLKRIALKGMQESTLPRICYIEELNFMIANLYHYGLDEEDFWKNLDQYHGPGTIEERFSVQVEAFVTKLKADGRNPDLVEVSSNMFDLARWAKQDLEAHESTEGPLSSERLHWYQGRLKKFISLTQQAFPHAVKLWRAATFPDHQAQELDFFNDHFGRSSADAPPHFAPQRVQQIDDIARRMLHPYRPVGGMASAVSSLDTAIEDGDASDHPKRRLRPTEQGEVSYNTWSSLVRGIPSHQLDRLHGGDLATPSVVIWSDIMLWHLSQGSTRGTQDLRK